jgi:cytochrome c oxidase assembly protein subunit 15
MSAVGNLVDLTPAAGVALTGALVAMLPLAVVALRLRGSSHDSRLDAPLAWQRALTLATLFLTIDLVVFGAFTRLTDSGLGCPDWPGCYGSTSPVGAHAHITQAQAAAPMGPVTHGKAWIEMLHRYLATAVGVMITALTGLAWWLRGKGRGAGSGGVSPWWPTATFIWVCAQGAFGALTVTLKLYPLVVSGHLVGGLLGVALLAAQARALDQGRASGRWFSEARALRRSAAWVLGIWFAQAALGAWVSTNGAVLACSSFPTCQGQWWPAMDWGQGMTLLRGLGEDGHGGYITLPGLTAIHMAHRLGAAVAALAVIWLIGQAWRGADGEVRDARVLGGLLLWQLITGLSNVVLDWPLAAALGHTLGAALTVAWLTRMVIPTGKVA